ncbi:MAG: hypothetical protein M1836_001404 [Candelina mexicana]|nr:MAG: hypothetical protein M1836_001404 [Candelina mexicana]
MDQGTATSLEDQLVQLAAARNLILSDAAFYPQIVHGVLPIIGAESRLELRRWGADFLAETFASPSLQEQQKQELSLQVLQTLKELLEIPAEDALVVKGVVQAAASIYPLVFRYIIANPNDASTWENMAAIKSKILRMWDTATAGVRVCCIKFVQQVVLVQTPGLINDPRRPEQNETSLALVPRTHQLIPPPNLEAEASGLLDRLLNVFHENTSDAVLVNSTLNCLGLLIRSRPSIANRILSGILNFNPLKQANSPMTPKLKVLIKSMERTTRALLTNINKRNPTGPLAGRIQQYIERLLQSRTDIFDEGSRKRAAPSEPTDGLDNAKRARLGADVSTTPQFNPSMPPLPPGPTSVAQLYTLTSDQGLATFDVQQLPIDLVARITIPILHRVDQGSLDQAINGLRSRYSSLSKQTPSNALEVAPPVNTAEDDDDDYEPDFQPIEDTEQVLNKLDNAPAEDSILQDEVSLAPFKIPHPLPLSEEETEQVSRGTMDRVFGLINVLDETTTTKKAKSGINRLAASSYDREAWITVITRLATRAPAGLNGFDPVVKTEADTEVLHTKPTLSNGIRESLYLYVMEDFRRRIDIAIAWLNEEWYNDRVQSGQMPNASAQYEMWALKVLDGIMPYLDAKDKILIRLLSEIPRISVHALERVKKLARDPERVGLAVNSIHYLILFRPPTREICIDALEDLYLNCEHPCQPLSLIQISDIAVMGLDDDARNAAQKLLLKWRPHVIEKEASTNGTPEHTKSTAISPSSAPAQAHSAIAAT